MMPPAEISAVHLWVMAAGLTAAGYLFGSIPFGLLVGLWKNVDIRTKGSCNIGATNAGRVLGKRYFYIVLLLDLLKGFVPTAAAGLWLRLNGFFEHSPVVGTTIWLAVAFAAVAGHNWPCWLGFKGGKGVSASLGVVLAIYPYYTFPGLAAFAIWIVVVAVTRYVSIGSIVAGLGFLIGLGLLFAFHPAWRIGDHWPLAAFAAVMVGLLIFRHRTNIARLRSGTENKFMAKAEGAS